MYAQVRRQLILREPALLPQRLHSRAESLEHGTLSMLRHDYTLHAIAETDQRSDPERRATDKRLWLDVRRSLAAGAVGG